MQFLNDAEHNMMQWRSSAYIIHQLQRFFSTAKHRNWSRVANTFRGLHLAIQLKPYFAIAFRLKDRTLFYCWVSELEISNLTTANTWRNTKRQHRLQQSIKTIQTDTESVFVSKVNQFLIMLGLQNIKSLEKELLCISVFLTHRPN